MAAGLVALGVAMEFVGDWASKPFEKTISEGRRLEIVGLTARALDAEKQIATSNKNANEAASVAALATERTAKIEQAAAWRILSQTTKDRLVASLKTSRGSIELSYPANDPEALFLASQIEDVFNKANAGENPPLWNVTPQPRQYSRAIFFGIRIFGQNSDVASFLKSSFTSASIPTGTEVVPNILNDSPGMMIGGTQPLDAMIFVGSKLPPN